MGKVHLRDHTVAKWEPANGDVSVVIIHVIVDEIFPRWLTSLDANMGPRSRASKLRDPSNILVCALVVHIVFCSVCINNKGRVPGQHVHAVQGPRSRCSI